MVLVVEAGKKHETYNNIQIYFVWKSDEMQNLVFIHGGFPQKWINRKLAKLSLMYLPKDLNVDHLPNSKGWVQQK